MKGKKGTILAQIAKKVARRIGAKVLLDPEWGMGGQIIFKDGRHSYFKYNTLDLNPVGSSEIAKDKDYANFFMKSMDYPIVPGGKTFYSNEWAKAIDAKDRRIDAAYAYAKKLGFPVIVKPNGGAQGFGVALVHDRREFYAAMRVAFTSDKIVLVQKPVYGKDYRLVVLDDKVMAAYERMPLSVIGNGKSTIAQLLRKKQIKLSDENRVVQIDPDDERIVQKLKRQGMKFSSIPAKGLKVFLLDNANLSAGGDSVDVTKNVHLEFKKMAVKLTKDMGLRLCGVDIMVDGDIADKPKKYWILEINAGPGLDHFAKMGKRQEKIVEDLYSEMLKSLSSNGGKY
ncbi:MAG: cyanophycin synthetase [Candidatus Pacebacteria bacterium]|nr:cyanophycin synthetase [Candidatus Paceibacterota bacterium]